MSVLRSRTILFLWPLSVAGAISSGYMVFRWNRPEVWMHVFFLMMVTLSTACSAAVIGRWLQVDGETPDGPAQAETARNLDAFSDRALSRGSLQRDGMPRGGGTGRGVRTQRLDQRGSSDRCRGGRRSDET